MDTIQHTLKEVEKEKERLQEANPSKSFRVASCNGAIACKVVQVQENDGCWTCLHD